MEDAAVIKTLVAVAFIGLNFYVYHYFASDDYIPPRESFSSFEEKLLPREFIREDGFHITEGFRRYCLPLIQGEDYPPYENGLPAYRRLKRTLLPRKLEARKKG